MLPAGNAHYKESHPSYVIIHDNSVGLPAKNTRYLPSDLVTFIFNRVDLKTFAKSTEVCKQWRHFFHKSMSIHFGGKAVATATIVNYLKLAMRIQQSKSTTSVSYSVGALYCHFENGEPCYATESRIVSIPKPFKFDHTPSTAAVFANSEWIVATAGLVYRLEENQPKFINYPPANIKIVELRSEGSLIFGLCHDRSALITVNSSIDSMRIIKGQDQKITSFEVAEGKFFVGFEDGSVEIGSCDDNQELQTQILFHKGNSPVTSMRAAYGKLYMGKENGELSVWEIGSLKYVRFGQLHKSAVISIAVHDCFVFTLSSLNNSATVLCHNRFTPYKISQLEISQAASKIFYGRGILAVARCGKQNDFLFFNYNPVMKLAPSPESPHSTPGKKSSFPNPVKGIKKLIYRG